MQDVMVPCKGCSNKVPASSLKMDLDLGKMVCPDYIKNKKIHKEIEQEVYHKPEAKQSAAPANAVSEEKSAKIAHKCTSCGYKFKIDSETGKPKYCPYCNAKVMGF